MGVSSSMGVSPLSKNGSGPGNGGGSSDGPGPGPGPGIGGPFLNGFVRGLGFPGNGLLVPPPLSSVSSVVSPSVFLASIQVFRSGQSATGEGL